MTMTPADLAGLVDHTLLRPEANAAEVADLIIEARALGVHAVCISPSLLPLAHDPGQLRVAAVCGFPAGAHHRSVKAAEAQLAAAEGAHEIDMVIDLAAATNGDFATVEAGIAAVRTAAPATTLKVIMESALLTDEQIVAVCEAAERAGADFVKTSTGFHPSGGASIAAVELMHRTVGGRLGIKASGGIRDWATAVDMVEAGATRLGLSRTAAILDDAP